MLIVDQNQIINDDIKENNSQMRVQFLKTLDLSADVLEKKIVNLDKLKKICDELLDFLRK